MDDERPPEIFRGHWEECFKHFAKVFEATNPPSTRAAAKAKRPIAEFCGISADTFTGWMRDRNKPQGITLIKLMCFLDMMGYTVIELTKIPQTKRGFFELIGYGLLSVDEAIKLLSYKEFSTLYQVMFGHVSANEERIQKMWDIWKDQRTKLDEKKKQVRTEYRLTPSSHGEEREQKDRPKVLLTTSRCGAIVCIMQGLLALLEEKSIKEFSEQDLAGLQSETNTVLRLSAQLNNLSSCLIMSDRKRSGGG